MENELNFTGWGDNPNYLSGKTIGDLFKDKTPRSSTDSSPISKEPVVINKTPKDGPRRTLSTGPVYKTGGTQAFSVSNIQSLSIPQGTSIPFTAGTTDYSFPAGGGYQVDGFDGNVYDIKVQVDGKYLVAGDFANYYNNGDNYYSPYLIRLNTDGTYDDTFNTTNNWDCYDGSFNGPVNTIEIQPDGKILVGGEFSQYDNGGDCFDFNRIIRLNSDASIDFTFNIGNGIDGDVYDMVLQPDGKLIVVGDFIGFNGNDASNIVRLNSNGSRDASFLIGDSNVAFNNYVNVVKLDSNNKILVGGWFTSYGNVTTNYIARLNTNGSLDTTFITGEGFNDEVNDLKIQSDGKIIVGGYFQSYDNNDLYNGRLVRINSDGSLDTRFGYGVNNTVNSIEIQSDGKILVGGDFSECYPDQFTFLDIDELIRFNNDCTFDYSFYYGELLNDNPNVIVAIGNDQILIGGNFYDGNPEIYPFNYFGRLHNSITDYKYTYRIEACVQPLQGETVTYVVGSNEELVYNKTYSFQSIQNPSITVCGFIPEGYLYPSNEVEYSLVNTYDNCEVAYKSNYRPVVLLDTLNNNTTTWVVDNQFKDGDILFVDTVFDGEGTTYVKFAATILSGTTWGEVFGSVWYYLPPVNYATYTSVEEAIEANGVIYESYSCSAPTNNYTLIHKAYYGPKTILTPYVYGSVNVIFDYLPFGDYAWISGGTPEIFSTIEISDGENCSLGLSKLAPEGFLDSSFQNTGFDGNLVYTTVEQPDGKILVGGNFNAYLEVNVGNFMRINPDGSLDETFYLGQFDSYVRAITLQPDGKILVGGNFEYYNEEYASKIIRLNADGTIDQSFTYGEEFDNIVRAIAVQRDGKIVVGGDFNYYYDFYCPQIVRLNSDGTPDPTFVMGDGFDGDQVFTINIESTLNTPFYHTNTKTYTENIIVGGWFNWYNGTNVGGIVKLSSTGEVLPDFGGGFNIEEGSRPRVNQIVQQPDGKLIIIGGADGGQLLDYNGTWIPQNIVRLQNINGTYVIDTTFNTRDFDNTGGFNNGVQTATVLPNGKIMVGGSFNYYGDSQDIHLDLPHLVRLNSNGTLDETFTFNLDDDQVNKVMLLSTGELLVGGRFDTPYDKLLKLFIGEEYVLRSFETCDGELSNIFLPTNSNVPISTGSTGFTSTPITYELISTEGLELVYDGDDDDSDYPVTFPTPFDINFLGINYTSINVSTNPYVTFGEGGSPDECCFDIPNEIPNNVGLPGVFLSFQCDAPSEPGDYDANLLQLYTGLTDNGNTLIIKYFGRDHCEEIKLINYTFRFFKDNSEYFDLLIDENTLFFNDDPTGGVSNGVDETWVTTFDSTGGNAYRIGSVPVVSKAIKANINNRVVECGTVGDIITTPNSNGDSIGGSMYFDGNTSLVTMAHNGQMDLNFGHWTVEWYQKYTSTDTCCRRVFDIGQWSQGGEEFGLSIENNNTILLWMAKSATTITLNTPVYNTWSYFAITSENLGGTSQIIRVYQDGALIYSGTTDVDLNNFQGDPSVDLDLVLGGGNSGDGSLFEGYITNFRWTKGSCYYQDSTMDVPTIPLPPYNSQLLFLTTDEVNLFTNTCEPYPNGIPANEITQNNVIWSSETPFINLNQFSLYTATNTTSYDDCQTCLSGLYYTARVLVRDGVNPDYVKSYSVTQQTINNLQTLGPIMTTNGTECYEVLTYFK